MIHEVCMSILQLKVTDAQDIKTNFCQIKEYIICNRVLVVFHCQLIVVWSNVYPFLNLLLLNTKYRIKGERKGEICRTRFYLMP